MVCVWVYVWLGISSCIISIIIAKELHVLYRDYDLTENILF